MSQYMKALEFISRYVDLLITRKRGEIKRIFENAWLGALPDHLVSPDVKL